MVNQYISKSVDITDIPQEEFRWSSVSLSEVTSRSNRLEASVFDIEGKHAREILNNGKWDLKTITGNDGIATAYHRPRFRRVWVKKSEYPIFQPSQVTEINPKPSGFISKVTDTNMDALRVKLGQILITCSGTIGKTTLVSTTLDNKIFSHDLIRINCQKEIDIGYLYAFLNTKIGNILINTNSYGAVISHIEPEHLDNVPIPNPPDMIKKLIHDKIIKSFVLRDESNLLLEKANSLLIKELNLPNISDIKPDYFTSNVPFINVSVKLSELNNRVDASYHVPIIKSIVDHLKKNASEVATIGDSRISKRVLLPGRFKRVYVEEGQGTVFFGGKQIYDLNPSSKKYLSFLHHGKRIKEELELKEDMILITCSGTIGKTTLVPKHWEGWTANQHIIRIIPNSKNIAGYLFVYLSSDYGYELITRFTYGSVVDEIDDKHVSAIAVPFLNNKEAQEEINNMALVANRKRYEAYKFEQEAITIINESVIHASV